MEGNGQRTHWNEGDFSPDEPMRKGEEWRGTLNCGPSTRQLHAESNGKKQHEDWGGKSRRPRRRASGTERVACPPRRGSGGRERRGKENGGDITAMNSM